MALVFSKLSDIELKDGVSITEFNNSMQKLISNDKTLYIGNNDGTPGLWEMKWYNDQSIEKYNKGQAVWLNTETWDNLIKTREADIIRYASSDPYLKRQFDQLSGDTLQSERWRLCKKVADGSYNGIQLFYIGDPSKKVQIKISNCDNNSDLPLDSSDKWDDFFQDFDEVEIKQQIFESLNEKLSSTYATHAIEYHLSGNIADDQTLFSTYMKNDMSNAVFGKRFQSHFWYQNLDGVDRIKEFRLKKFQDGCNKWFRVWNSGLIEHGGIVDIYNPCGNDKFISSVYTVDLEWEYNDSKFAPIYDYPTGGLQKLYGPDKKYNINCTYYNLPQLNTSSKMHIHVEVSPVNVDLVQPYKTDIQGLNQSDICFIKNNSFGIVVTDERIHKYSYLVRGYSNSSRKF